jgi:hypothetical protein
MNIKKFGEKMFRSLDRYAIWHIPGSSFEILKITGVLDALYGDRPENEYTSEILYYYYPNTDKFKKSVTPSKSGVFYEFELVDYIKYTSDSLKDCKDMVKIISKEIKYNL